MIYNLEKIRLRKVAEGKRNAGQLFVQFLARNPKCRLDKMDVTILDEDFAADYAEYLELAEPDGTDQFGNQKWKASKLKDVNNPLPDSLTVQTNANIELFPTPGGEIWYAVDDNNQQRFTEKGKPIAVLGVPVFTIRRVDNETGKDAGYCVGFDPVSQGMRLLTTFFAPASDFKQTAPQGIVLPQDAETQLINSGSTPAAPATPAATPAV